VSRQPLYYAIEPCTPDPVAAAIAATGAAVTAVGGPVWLGPAVLVNRSCSAEKDLRQSQLGSAIRSTIAQYPGAYSVSVHQLDGLRVTTDVGGGVRREPASMMKIYAAWAALQLIERGEATWGTRLSSGVDLSTCIHVMIHASDNGCHSDIVHWIGIGRLNWMIQASGWTQTSYGSVPPGTSVLYAGNRTTSNDLSNILERLASGNALTRPYADHLLRLMTDQIWRSRIASGIPPGVRQATKPGSLWVSSGLMQGDSGVVWGTESTYVLSIIGDQAPPQAALRAISRTVYEYFNGPFGTAAWYPAQQMVTVRATALRTSPGGAMTVVLPAGAPVEVLDANRIWYQLRYGDRQLWTVFSDLRNR
jgi:beta-lactamase class A